MVSKKKTESDHLDEARQSLLDVALVHVPFDGWSAVLFKNAVRDAGVDESLAKLACPRGAVDLALAFHRRGDAEMVERLGSDEMRALRYRDRIMAGVRFRLEAVEADKEIVQRGITLFALPANLADGSAAIWQTCNLIWNTLGDTSEDVNWYTKRATLSAVYSSTVLFWLGDQSEGHRDTWDFLDRRIENVMQFEKFKGKLRKNPVFQSFMKGPGQILDRIVAPKTAGAADRPGFIKK